MLELSSFQLETTESLHLVAATVLNVSSDHLDRYASLQDYAAAKARIFARCDTAVINLDDPLVARHGAAGAAHAELLAARRIGADYALAMRSGDGGSRAAASR